MHSPESQPFIQGINAVESINAALLQNSGIVSPVIATHKDTRLEDLEPFLPNRSRLRCVYKTQSIDDFVSYSQQFDSPNATCFIDENEMRALNLLDLGTTEQPLHQDHHAILQLKQTAFFEALLSMNGQHVSQKRMAEFFEDWGDMVSTEIVDQNNNDLSLIGAVKAFRDLTIESVSKAQSKVGDFNESLSTMEQIEAKAEEALPAKVIFQCEPYSGLNDVELTCRFSIITSEEKPKLVLRILRLEAQMEAIAQDFKDIIKEDLSGCDVSIYLGKKL